MFKSRNSFTFSKQFSAFSEPVFTKLTFSRQNFLMNSPTEFDENASYYLVIDIKKTKLVDRDWCSCHKRHSSLVLTERLNTVACTGLAENLRIIKC